MRRIGRRAATVAAALWMAAAAGAGAQVVLCRDGAARSAIVANGNAGQAKALAEYLGRISGAEIPVVETLAAMPGDRAAVVLSVAGTVPGLGDRPTAAQGYRIHTEGGRLHLTARTAQGLSYAVYGFLDDHLGVRFFAPDAERIPKLPTVSVGTLDDRQEPAFLSRAFSTPYGHPLAGQEPLYREKNRGNTPRIGAHHNFYAWIPPGEYLAKNPEWFPVIDGKRQSHGAMALCATNEALARELAARFTAQMDKMDRGETKGLIGVIEPFAGYPAIFSAAQGDGFRRCECPECAALVAREGTEAAPYIAMLNRALEITAEKHPDKKVITFAYYGTLKPPKTLRAHPNLWINIVSSSLSPYPAGDQLGPIRDNVHNRDYREAIEAWTKLAPGRVTIWDWTGNFTDATVEWPNIFSVADNVRFFRENGVAAVFLEQPGGEQNWGWLRKWVWARMMWNPALAPEPLVREFLAGYYGERAAPFLWEYIRYADRAARESRYASATVRWSCYPSILRSKIFTDGKLAAMSALMDAALDAAAGETDPVFRARVRQAAASSLDGLLLTGAGAPARVTDPRDGSLWLVPGGRPDFPERIDRVAETWMKTGASGATSWHHRYRFLQRIAGGRLERIANETFAVEVLPAARGQIYSLVHLPTGREILAPGADAQIGGYTDRLPGATTTVGWQDAGYHALWPKPAREHALLMAGLPVVSPWHSAEYFARMRQRYEVLRTVVLPPGAESLTVERRYAGRRIRPEEQVFEAAWSFAVPDPAKARLTVREGKTERSFGLGSIRRKTGRTRTDDRPVPFTDVMMQDFDFVEGKGLTIGLAETAGDLVVLLDRGDGLAVELSTPAAGNRTLSLTPVPAEGRLSVAIAAAPRPLPADKDTEIDLPPQRIRVMAAGKSPAAPRVRTNLRDGAEMVFIPAGRFLMGSPAGTGNADESPQRSVNLDGYWIYRHPVTVKRYRAFCEATGRTMPSLPRGSDGENHPVFNVNWHDARAYAAWAGGSLPTEAQWEKAARGTDGRVYPWCDRWEPDRCVSMEKTHGELRYATLPVGSAPAGASPYGVMDMAGLVWEWTADWYDPEAYRTMAGENPAGAVTGEFKVLRGGSLNWNEWYSRSAYRNVNPPSAVGWIWTGFRCVLPESPGTR